MTALSSISLNTFPYMRLLGLIATVPAVFGVTALLGIQDAQAHGTNPNLVKYCYDVFSKGKIKLPLDRKWYTRYNTKARRWECYKPQTMGFNTTVPEYVRVLDVADACWRQKRTPKVHFHEGSNVRSAKAVHCGITDGTVAKGSSRGAKVSTLRLCNRSTDNKIFAAYAYWDIENRRDKGWTATGWYNIERGRCRDLSMGRAYKGDVYVYAESGTGKWGAKTGGSNFCIDPKKGFTINHGDKTACQGQNRKRVRMSKYKIAPGVNTYNFR